MKTGVFDFSDVPANFCADSEELIMTTLKTKMEAAVLNGLSPWRKQEWMDLLVERRSSHPFISWPRQPPVNR